MLLPSCYNSCSLIICSAVFGTIVCLVMTFCTGTFFFNRNPLRSITVVVPGWFIVSKTFGAPLPNLAWKNMFMVDCSSFSSLYWLCCGTSILRSFSFSVSLIMLLDAIWRSASKPAPMRPRCWCSSKKAMLARWHHSQFGQRMRSFAVSFAIDCILNQKPT